VQFSVINRGIQEQPLIMSSRETGFSAAALHSSVLDSSFLVWIVNIVNKSLVLATKFF